MQSALEVLSRVAVRDGSGDDRADALEVLRELCSRGLGGVEYVRMFLDVRPVEPRRADVGEAIVQAVGLSALGEVEVLGYDVGRGETCDFWSGHLAALRARGLHGLRVLESREHGGVAAALGEVFPGARWQEVTEVPPWVPERLLAFERDCR